MHTERALSARADDHLAAVGRQNLPEVRTPDARVDVDIAAPGAVHVTTLGKEPQHCSSVARPIPKVPGTKVPDWAGTRTARAESSRVSLVVVGTPDSRSVALVLLWPLRTSTGIIIDDGRTGSLVTGSPSTPFYRSFYRTPICTARKDAPS
jgi:hypothetical protein